MNVPGLVPEKERKDFRSIRCDQGWMNLAAQISSIGAIISRSSRPMEMIYRNDFPYFVLRAPGR